jgi:hypothetical protein
VCKQKESNGEGCKIVADKVKDLSVGLPNDSEREMPPFELGHMSKQLDTFRSEMHLGLKAMLATARSNTEISMLCKMQDEVSQQVAVAVKAMGEQIEEKAKIKRQEHEERVKDEQERCEEITKEERQRGKWEQERLRDEIKRLEARLDSIMLVASQNQVQIFLSIST